MQKLEKRRQLTNTPTDAPQVRGNCDLSLNREETLGVPGLKTSSNNPEVDLLQHTGGLKVNVYVRSCVDGSQLMPCTAAKARKLLLTNKARVVKLYPFTIRLNFECENQIQKIDLGLDTGYNHIGVSCITNTKELVSGVVLLDGKTSSRLTERAMYRRGRRSRHHWYRKPRFLNRKKKEGWLPPSVQRRYNAHLRIINIFCSVLPIKDENIYMEIGQFDIQKIENPGINGVGYQQGDMYDYQNMRSYLMAREKGSCQICHKEFTSGNPAHIHHCKQRNEQGSNRAKNLAILHKKCHGNLHKNNLKISSPKELKAETFMSILQSYLKKQYPLATFTFGYITFVDRNKLNIPKTHNNDAFVIAGGSNQQRTEIISITQKHRNNRAIQLNRNGFKPSIRKQRYNIQPKDLIWVDGKKHQAVGVQNSGKYIKVAGLTKVIPTNKIEKQYNFGGFAYA